MFLRYVAIAISFVFTLQGFAQSAEKPASGASKQNLLFIMTDQQQYRALSIAGNTVLQTPNLDRLAHEGAFFKNAYTPSAVCTPARSSILTGHTIENTGINRNKQAYSIAENLMTMPTFDEILTDAGYHSEYYGKWHTRASSAAVYKNPVLRTKNGRSIFSRGGSTYAYLDYIDEHFPQRALRPGELYDTYTLRPYKLSPLDSLYGQNPKDIDRESLRRAQPDLFGESMIPAEHSITAFQAGETIKALERLQDQPFSITCSFHFPHAPMLPSSPYYGMYPVKEMAPPESIDDDMKNSPYKRANRRTKFTEFSDPEKIQYMISNYYGLIREIDDWVGEILDKLEELELADKTLVIFASDHGEMLGAHGMREKNVFYEESSHIPLLIRFPGVIEPDKAVAGYVSLVDLFPTILDYLEIEEHPSDGKSLRGMIEGTDLDHGKYVVTEWDMRGDKEPNYMVVSDNWKLMMPYSKKSKVINAMYDLDNDPHEMNNLLGSNPRRKKYEKRAEQLRGYLLEWLRNNNSKHYQGVGERELI